MLYAACRVSRQFTSPHLKYIPTPQKQGHWTFTSDFVNFPDSERLEDMFFTISFKSQDEPNKITQNWKLTLREIWKISIYEISHDNLIQWKVIRLLMKYWRGIQEFSIHDLTMLRYHFVTLILSFLKGQEIKDAKI